jgi:mono/diheme cytochrome c family protein
MPRKFGASQGTDQSSPASRGAALLASAAFFGFALAGTAAAQTADGKAVYVEANCVGCHKWHGQGGGGYGGAALSLRETTLERDDLIEVIRCGRPGTGMPFHLRTAWKSTECYGMEAADIGADMPPTAAKFLRDHQIEAVADYVIENLQGHGEPTREECAAFWGDNARECSRF